MRELETSLQQFGEFLLKAQLVKERAAPYCVASVRRFLIRPASNEPLADQVRGFCEQLEQDAGWQDWQVRQAEHALRIYVRGFENLFDPRYFVYSTYDTLVGSAGAPAPFTRALSAIGVARSRRWRARTAAPSAATNCTTS